MTAAGILTAADSRAHERIRPNPLVSASDQLPPDSAIQTRSQQRLRSLDTYRGIVMFCLFAGGFGLAKVADTFADSDFWQWLKFLTTHPSWESQFQLVGFSPWDMIQPAFMFMVGVSMPYSYGKREALGQSYRRRLIHAWGRALILVLLGVFLQSMRRPETNWLFTNVLGQIGLGYGFLFFLVGKRFRVQIIVAALILVGYYLLMLPWGFENRSSMPQRFDIWFLNLFPRTKPFAGHDYATLNFVPSVVTMLFGLMCGQLLKDDQLTAGKKVQRLLIAGGICLVLGIVFGFICPIIKKLWTPSWTLFSGAYVIWMLAFLYWVIDVKRWQWGWSTFFVVVGMNSIAAYFMGQLMKPFARGIFHTHLPADFWQWTGAWQPIAEALLVALFFWVLLFWMYRNRVYVRI